jgi:hypothetical protein
MRAFISYAHADEAAKDRLMKHLSVLRDEGAIDDWHDREILPGEVIDDAISEQLESRDLFIAMVSPDFLASDYIKHKEMGRAFERYESGEMLVVPIIVEECDWKHTALVRLMALPKDGKAISLWENENQAFTDVVAGLRRLIEAHAEQVHSTEPAKAAPTPTGPTMRVQRDFDSIARGDFRDDCFRTIEAYFQDTAAQLDARDGFRCRFRSLGPTSFTCTLLNQQKEGAESHITVHSSGESSGLGDIYYSNSANASANTANGWLTVESDGYDLRLKLNQFWGEDQYVSAQSAAEILWKDFAGRAGVEYD